MLGRATSSLEGVAALLNRGLSAVFVVRGLLSATLALCALAGQPALAQDPSPSAPIAGVPINPGAGPTSTFAKSNSGFNFYKRTIDRTKPVYIQADEVINDANGNRVRARGNVELYFNDYVLTADELTYDRNAGTVTASGNVMLKDPDGQILRGERITLDESFREIFAATLSVIGKDNVRIVARSARRTDANVVEFRDGKYSPCKSEPGQPPLWCIAAARIVQDQKAGTITYQDAEFDLLGQPVLYAPYFQHPDPSVKRQTGFLFPQFGSSSRYGVFGEIPYYIALDPSFDFTFHPLFSSKVGPLWQGDWRQRVAFGDVTGQYNIKLAGIDQAWAPITNSATGQVYNDWRGTLTTQGKFSLASWWSFGWDITLESDDAFRRYYGFDGVIQTDRVNSVFLNGLSERSYFAVTGYYLGSLVANDTPQGVDRQASSQVYPVLDWNYVSPKTLPGIGGEFGFDVNALAFTRPRGDTLFNNGSTLVPIGPSTDIQHVVAQAHWRRKLTDQVGITYTPFAEIRGDYYEYQNAINALNQGIIGDESVARGVASGGVLVSYPWIAAGNGGAHTIEPIGQIIGRTAHVEQRQLPDDDAKSLIFDDTNLFDIDKFSGYDRIETGTRANVGLQYTFQANSGPFVRLLAGQSYHLAGTNAFQSPGVDGAGQPLFTPTSGLQTDTSDYVLGAYASAGPNLRGIAQARFDEATGDLRRLNAYAQANYGPFWASGLYSFATADPLVIGDVDHQEILGWLGVRLTDRWSLAGSSRFNLVTGQAIQDIVQLKYTDDCFALTTTYTETFITDTANNITPDHAIMVRFELKSLGAFDFKTNVLDSNTGTTTSPSTLH